MRKSIYPELFIKLLVSLPILFSGVFLCFGSVVYTIEKQDLFGVLGLVLGLFLVFISFTVFKKIYPKD